MDKLTLTEVIAKLKEIADDKDRKYIFIKPGTRMHEEIRNSGLPYIVQDNIDIYDSDALFKAMKAHG